MAESRQTIDNEGKDSPESTSNKSDGYNGTHSGMLSSLYNLASRPFGSLARGGSSTESTQLSDALQQRIVKGSGRDDGGAPERNSSQLGQDDGDDTHPPGAIAYTTTHRHVHGLTETSGSDAEALTGARHPVPLSDLDMTDGVYGNTCSPSASSSDLDVQVEDDDDVNEASAALHLGMATLAENTTTNLHGKAQKHTPMRINTGDAHRENGDEDGSGGDSVSRRVADSPTSLKHSGTRKSIMHTDSYSGRSGAVTSAGVDAQSNEDEDNLGNRAQAMDRLAHLKDVSVDLTAVLASSPSEETSLGAIQHQKPMMEKNPMLESDADRALEERESSELKQRGESTSDAPTVPRQQLGDTSSNQQSSQLITGARLLSEEQTRIQETSRPQHRHTTTHWAHQNNHLLILSKSGKPIFSQHGDENALASMFGAVVGITTLSHDVATFGGRVKTIRTGDLLIHVRVCEPLIYVCASKGKDPRRKSNRGSSSTETGNGNTGRWLSESYLVVKAEYLQMHVLSALSGTQLQRIFAQHHNFDLRRLLGNEQDPVGMQRLRRLCYQLDVDPRYLMESISALPLDLKVREKLGVILKEERSEKVMFAVVLTSTHLVTMLSPRGHGLGSKDLHVLMNAVGVYDEQVLCDSKTFTGLKEGAVDSKSADVGLSGTDNHRSRAGEKTEEQEKRNNIPSPSRIQDAVQESEIASAEAVGDVTQPQSTSRLTDKEPITAREQSNGRVNAAGDQNSSDNTVETEQWLSICLPEFNDTGYLYAHVSHIVKYEFEPGQSDSSHTLPSTNITLMLISTERDSDTKAELRRTRSAIVHRIQNEAGMKDSLVSRVCEARGADRQYGTESGLIRLMPSLVSPDDASVCISGCTTAESCTRFHQGIRDNVCLKAGASRENRNRFTSPSRVPENESNSQKDYSVLRQTVSHAKFDRGFNMNLNERSGIPDRSHVRIKHIRQYVYVSKPHGQMLTSLPAPPYVHQSSRECLLSLYAYVRDVMNARDLEVYFHTGSNECVLGQHTQEHEVYCIFGPLVTKNQAVLATNRLVTGIAQYESQLFIMKPLLW